MKMPVCDEGGPTGYRSLRAITWTSMSARGYDVEMAEDGETALDSARTFQPDLVVLDLNLPSMDGFSVARELRNRSAVPILVLSVREDEPDKVEALDLGADDYLTKPFGTDELMARVRALLRRAGSQGVPAPGASGGTTWRSTSTPTRWFEGRGDPAHEDRVVAPRGPVPTPREAPDPSMVAGAGVGRRLCRRRRRAPRLHQPAPQEIEPDPSRPRIIVTDPGIGYRWLLRVAEELQPMAQ